MRPRLGQLVRRLHAHLPRAVLLVGAVYFAIFGAGTFYVLRLMGRSPQARLDEDLGPLRAAGITPAPALEARRPRHPAE